MSEPPDSDALALVVPNVVDYNFARVGHALDPRTRSNFVALGARQADPCILWSGPPHVVALPAGYDRSWWAMLHELLGRDLPVTVSPVRRRGGLVDDLLLDPDALVTLRAACGDAAELRLVSWGATESLYRLVSLLEAWGHAVVLDVPDPGDAWTTSYLDPKLSCGDLAGTVAGVRVPRGLTVSSWSEAEGAVDRLRADGRGVIVRSPVGVGGTGTVVLPGRGSGSVEAFWRDVRDDPLLGTFPLLVQELVGDPSGLLIPAVDLVVTADGVGEMFLSRLLVDGVAWRRTYVGQDVLPAASAEQVTAVSLAIAEACRDLRYRGWLGVDFVSTPAGELFVTELNARRTGGLHAYGSLAALGAGGTEVAVIDDRVPVRSGSPVPFEHVRPVFERAWERGLRALPVSARGLQRPEPSVSVVVVAEDEVAAESGLAELTAELHAEATV